MTLVAIHQPNFFPWMGYFDKIRRADVFVFLDDVDYPRSGSKGMGSWCNRVQLAMAGEAKWVTCPLKRAPLGTAILAVEIDDTQPWRTKLLRTLDASYRRAPGFAAAIEVIRPLLLNATSNLADFNIQAIKAIAAHLGLATRFVRQSELNCEGQSTELLAAIVKSVGGTAYLAGGGAAGYQDDAVFASAGIGLIMQKFVPTPYGPDEAWIPGLSVIDFLMKSPGGPAA